MISNCIIYGLVGLHGGSLPPRSPYSTRYAVADYGPKEYSLEQFIRDMQDDLTIANSYSGKKRKEITVGYLTGDISSPDVKVFYFGGYSNTGAWEWAKQQELFITDGDRIFWTVRAIDDLASRWIMRPEGVRRTAITGSWEASVSFSDEDGERIIKLAIAEFQRNL